MDRPFEIPGQAGLDVVRAVFPALLDEVLLIPEGGPGAHQGHLAPQDIPELGQLVQAALAQEFADPGDILGGILEQMGGNVMGRGALHAAEFMKLEEGLPLAEALLGKQHGTGIVDDDGGAEQKKQPGKKQQRQAGQKDVNGTLKNP